MVSQPAVSANLLKLKTRQARWHTSLISTLCQPSLHNKIPSQNKTKQHLKTNIPVDTHWIWERSGWEKWDEDKKTPIWIYSKALYNIELSHNYSHFIKEAKIITCYTPQNALEQYHMDNINF